MSHFFGFSYWEENMISQKVGKQTLTNWSKKTEDKESLDYERMEREERKNAWLDEKWEVYFTEWMSGEYM